MPDSTGKLPHANAEIKWKYLKIHLQNRRFMLYYPIEHMKPEKYLKGFYMSLPQFELKSNSCNAAETVLAALGISVENASSLDFGAAPDGECGALAAALSALASNAARIKLRDEFVKLTGSADCASLKGVHCSHCVELAIRLASAQLAPASRGKLPRLMLIGDSIRMNYQAAVEKELAGEFEVVAPRENSRFAKYALNELERWFEACGEPDIIHWNIGLWDSAVVCKEDGMFTKPEEYLYYMSRIQRELFKHTDKVIFATTTPVLPGSKNQHIEYIDSLNRIIVPFMQEQGVVINDLYSLLKAREKELQSADCIHLNPLGSQVLGKAVADAVRALWKQS